MIKEINEDDEFEKDKEDDIRDSEKSPIEDEDPKEEEAQGDTSNISISDDDNDDIDIVIEISDEDVLIEEVKEDKIDEIIDPILEEDDVVLSKHKMQGKHSLKYDSIFKGKKEEKTEEEEIDASFMYFNDKFELDKSSPLFIESTDNEQYLRTKLVKEKVYKILIENTTINFLNNRRKPSRIDFNNYYHLLKTHLVNDNFTNIEVFNELSVYFSDNLFNMFKLLDNKWRNMIINELQDHIGKTSNSKDIKNRNIYIGTELEFLGDDNLGNEILITGVVLECDYENSIFKVDSYENIYHIEISEITKVLNNEKFKYNLNKLNNIDFL